MDVIGDAQIVRLPRILAAIDQPSLNENHHSFWSNDTFSPLFNIFGGVLPEKLWKGSEVSHFLAFHQHMRT